MCGLKGVPPGPVKEENVSCTVSPQVQTTQVKSAKTHDGIKATNTVDFDIPLFNRFAALYSDDEQDIFVDTMSDIDVEIGDHCESTSPCFGKALCRDDFDKSLVKKRVAQDTIAQAKLCDDYIKCKSQMHRPFGVIPLSPLTTSLISTGTRIWFQLTKIMHQHFSEHVDEYIKEELSHGAMLGPFDKKPVHLHVSPFMTREKQDCHFRRTIVDLSWPKGQSVNSGVSKDVYLGTKFLLNYPSVDNIIQRLIQLEPGSMLFKIDISRAFHQLKVDPGDIDLLGLKQSSYFIDQSVPFGYRHGSIFFEKVTDSIRFIMKNSGFLDLYNYVDDLIYCGTPSTIFSAYEKLSSPLVQLGLQIIVTKLVPPSTSVTCLGILIDTETRTMSVPPEKLHNILQLCYQWENKKLNVQNKTAVPVRLSPIYF